MRSLLSCLALLGLSLAAPPALPSSKNVPSELIMGGHRAHQGNFPFYVSLIDIACGGSLITPKHVLTAAHCMGDDTVGTRAVMGLDDKETYEKEEGVQIRKIINVISHTGFNTNDWHDDIAIVEVDEPFEISNTVELTKIKANDTELQKMYWTAVVGFGVAKIIKNDDGTFSGDYPRYLQYAYIPLIDHDRCFQRWSILWDKQVCAGGEKEGTGPGDSGGPMSILDDGKFFQIGLVSYGSASAVELQNQAKTPVVYTRTASYCDWMNEKTNGAFQCL
ncbi:hypothetical protein QR680_011502 [Steinernema hermaphroditum]|uniref:Peptidase S1 domain-containing protein n=1 Tax=Steinernema hermaphroditum TaxID=289476 RepID=A0AA39I0G4_9BILA|nr:hypothetical protein QR680_011502 [Steinernema hermaphroditum]